MTLERTNPISFTSRTTMISRRRPFQPRCMLGAQLAMAVARDLVNTGALPVTIDVVNGWWLVVCQRDWLAGGTAEPSDYWFRTGLAREWEADGMPATQGSLATLSTNIVTATQERTEWIVGNDMLPQQVSDAIRRALARGSSGRVVAFTTY